MPRMMRSIEVQAMPNKVRDFIWDTQNLFKYMPVTHVEVMEQSDRRAKLRYDLNPGDGPLDMTAIGEMDASGRKIRFRAVEGMTFEETWILQQIRGGTQITHILDYEPRKKGLMGLISQGKTRKLMFEMCCATLDKLREQLQAGTSDQIDPQENARNLAA